MPAAEWCAKHELTEATTARIIGIQQRKIKADLEYILLVGELAVEARKEFKNGLYDECCKVVLGISARTAHRFAQIYTLHQEVPELNQASIELISTRALSLMQASKRGYEITTEQKAAILEEAAESSRQITEKQMEELKLALEKQAKKDQEEAVRNAIQRTKEGTAVAIKSLNEETLTMKQKIKLLQDDLQKARDLLPASATPQQVAEAAVNPPEPNSTNDRVVRLGWLRDDPGGQESLKATREPLMKWMAGHRTSLKKLSAELDSIKDDMHDRYRKHHFSYQLEWVGIDMLASDTEGKTTWKAAFGADRKKALQELQLQLATMTNAVQAIIKVSTYDEPLPFRVEE
jgi:hypothetical protein